MTKISVKVAKSMNAPTDVEDEMEEWLAIQKADHQHISYRNLSEDADDFSQMCWWDLDIKDPKLALLFKLTFGGV